MELSSEYGYVYFALIYVGIMNTWQATNVIWARKKYNVNYPTLYSDKEPIFNCYQVCTYSLLLISVTM